MTCTCSTRSKALDGNASYHVSCSRRTLPSSSCWPTAVRSVSPGWVSERFGERVESAVHVVDAELELPAAIGWRIRLR